MTGKTHFACGEALALCLLRPSTPSALLICLGAAAVGSVVSDVDVTTSESHRDLARIVSISCAAAALTWAANTILNLELQRFLLRFTSWAQLGAWAVLFLALCVFGACRPHRTFMHSLTGLALLGGCVWMGARPFALPFCVAMASHIALDLLNRKGMQLFYPLNRRFALRLCASNGMADRLFCLAGGLGLAAGLALFNAGM